MAGVNRLSHFRVLCGASDDSLRGVRPSVEGRGFHFSLRTTGRRVSPLSGLRVEHALLSRIDLAARAAARRFDEGERSIVGILAKDGKDGRLRIRRPCRVKGESLLPYTSQVG